MHRECRHGNDSRWSRCGRSSLGRCDRARAESHGFELAAWYERHRAARGGWQQGRRLFADNTLGAIWQGAQHALGALVERCVQALQQEVGQSVIVLVTGGGAALIEPSLRISFRSVPDLVLRGLAVLARESQGSARV